MSATCKTCKVPMYKRTDGKYAAESRSATPPKFEGTDRRKAPGSDDPAPVRFHFLNRPLFGRKQPTT